MALFHKFSYRSFDDAEHEKLIDIVENLNNILNSRKEFGSFLPDLGIRDLNEYTSKDHIIKAVMEEVMRNIRLYEPRVELVDMTVEDSDSIFQLSFKIECIVRENTRSLRMVFDSVLNDFYVERP